MSKTHAFVVTGPSSERVASFPSIRRRRTLSINLSVRRAVAVPDKHLFLSAGNRRISSSMVNYTFRRILKLANIAPERTRRPRIHDLRHYPDWQIIPIRLTQMAM